MGCSRNSNVARVVVVAVVVVVVAVAVAGPCAWVAV